ncbi:MAG: DUF6314 family protein [Paracoccaceae bacterium]|nr:DUF6314 family protein [Paracoccaceae bacterium]
MPGLPSLWALEGTWRLDRTIRHETGETDRFTGTCVFQRSGTRLLQDETGTLETGGASFEATRRYVWAESNGRLDVYFDDMRPFHSIPLNTEAPETVHLCDPDRYQVAYDFGRWPEWRATWRVEGPRKSYTMQSVYQPSDPAAHLAVTHAGVHNATKD